MYKYKNKLTVKKGMKRYVAKNPVRPVLSTVISIINSCAGYITPGVFRFVQEHPF